MTSSSELLPHAVSARADTAEPPLARRLGRRLRYALPVKAVGTTAAIWCFFLVYFAVPGWSPFEPTRIAPTWLERALPLWDAAFIPYASLWLYVSLAPALCADRRELRACAASCIALALAGLAVFWLHPTQLMGEAIDWRAYPMLHTLHAADGGSNAFPSLHVAFAVLTGVILDGQLGALAAPAALRHLNRAWCLAIVLSTLLTRQHVLLDVAGGALLAAPCWWLHVRLLALGADEQAGGGAGARP